MPDGIYKSKHGIDDKVIAFDDDTIKQYCGAFAKIIKEMQLY